MAENHEERILRRRQEEALVRNERRPKRDCGTPAILGQIYNGGAMPSSLPGRFATHPTILLGAETEGSTPTYSVDTTRTIFFTVVGSTVPIVGDVLMGKLIDGRWCAKRGGGSSGGPHTLPGCPCTVVPDTLFMHVATQPTNGTESVVFPCTLTFQPTPSDIPGVTPNPSWYSDGPYTSTNGNYIVRYRFGCSLGLYFVDAWTTTSSPLGGAFSIASWAVGFTGNQCSPFEMGAGGFTSWHSPNGQPDQGVVISTTGPP